MSRRRRADEESEDYGEEEEEEEEEEQGGGGGGGRSRRGFASMPKEKVRAIAAKGGRASGKRRQEESEEEEEEDEGQDRGGRYGGGGGRSRRGFASMPKVKVRAIASKGGRVSGKRRREESEDLGGTDRYGDEYGRRRTRRRREDLGEEEQEPSEEEQYDRRRGRSDNYAYGPAQTVRRMYETGERRPKHSLREEDQGVGYEGEEESMEDRMGYYGKGARKGFATMPKERVREIASKGGRHSHGFKHKAKYAEGSMDEVSGEEDEQKGGYYRVGFAAMPKERVRQIARKGGRRSHGYGDEEGEGEEDYRLGQEDEERYPMLKPSANRARRSGYAY